MFTGGADVNVLPADRRRGRRPLGPGFEPLLDAVRRLEALPIPTLALVHGLCLTAGLEVSLGCDMIWAGGVGAVRPGRGGGRAHPRRRRHPADGRARGPGARPRVRDVPGPLRRGDAGALERGQPGAWPTTSCSRRGCGSRSGSRPGPTKAHAATKRIVRAYLEGGVDRGRRGHARGRRRAVRDRGPASAPCKSFLTDGPGKATFEGRSRRARASATLSGAHG